MKFSYNWLKELSKTKLSPEKMAEILTMHSFEVKEVKKAGKDWLIDIDILPNRLADCASHMGIARECLSLTNSLLWRELAQPAKLKEDKTLKAKDFISVEVKDKDLCPRYCARVITDVNVEPSPKWLKERLKICGIQSINNVVDATNYVMLETGQPLHAFDFDKIEVVGKPLKIRRDNSKRRNPALKNGINRLLIIRKARKGEKITTLDDKKYDLDENVLVIADIKEAIAIAGIKGGKKAGIDGRTKNIVLESANFDRLNIYKTSKRIKLQTDASLRFGAGLDPNLASIAIDRAGDLIQKIAGGKIAQGIIDFYPQKVKLKRIQLDLDYVERLLGIKIPKQKVLKILKSLGLTIIRRGGIPAEGGRILNVVIPTFRLDIALEEDLIEEIGRIYGYEKIPVVFPVGALIPPKRNEEIFWEEMTKDILKELGFIEVYNYSFLSEKDINVYLLNQLSNKSQVLEIENPVSAEQKYLRPSLIFNLLKNVKNNLRYFEKIKIFELGKIYNKNAKSPRPYGAGPDGVPLSAGNYGAGKMQKVKIMEKRMLTGVITKKVGATKDEEFYELKGVIDTLLNKLGISDVWYDDYQPTPEDSKISIWQQGKGAEIKLGQEEIGFLGEINSKALENLEISTKVFVFDLDFEKLQKLASEEQEFRPISRHPAAIRDIAILVPKNIRVEEVLNKIYNSGGSLVRDVDLFDIYEPEAEQERKSLAFHIVFQAEDRTLNSKELDDLMKKIINALEKNPEWEVRSK